MTTTFNSELARRVLEFIKTNPKLWNQEVWAEKNLCGTSFCFAGHVVNASYQGEVKFLFDEDEQLASAVEINGEIQDICLLARELLGLDPDDQSGLFFGHNSLSDLEEIIESLENQNTV